MLENSYGTVSVDGKKLWLRQDAYAVGTLGNSYYEALAVDAQGCAYKVRWETTQIWNISEELGHLHFELSQTRDASEQTVLRQNIRALDAVAERYGGAVDIEDESNACDWDRYSVAQLDVPEFEELRSNGDTQLYRAGKVYALVVNGFSTGNELGVHNQFDTEAIVYYWQGAPRSFNDISMDRKSADWVPYTGFDFGGNEDGPDWDAYEQQLNLVLTSLSQDTSIASDVARKQAQNARGVNEQMRRKPEYPCRSDER